jgi:drug/metabolite transporter superfamily protein YnfA
MADAAKPMEGTAKIKFVDAGGLALMLLGAAMFMLFAFLCNIDNVGPANMPPKTKPEDNHFGVFYLPDMCTWACGMGLTVCGLVQGLNGDHLGFTSYVFHAAIVGTIGYNFKCLLGGCGKLPSGSLSMVSFFCYAAVWYNLIFSICAFRMAKVFGVLYVSLAITFLVIGLNWQAVLHDEKDKDYDRTGDYITGICTLTVALQCFYLVIPVMTGLGVIM